MNMVYLLIPSEIPIWSIVGYLTWINTLEYNAVDPLPFEFQVPQQSQFCSARALKFDTKITFRIAFVGNFPVCDILTWRVLSQNRNREEEKNKPESRHMC